MSNDQIKQIIDKLEAQDKVLKAIVAEQAAAKIKFETIETKLDPVYTVFESVTGFNAIAVWILKALILLGAGIGVVYGFIKFLKA